MFQPSHQRWWRYVVFPGLNIKRWLALLAVGMMLTVIGVALLFNLQPVAWLIGIAKELAQHVPNTLSGSAALFIGGGFLLLALRQARANVSNAMGGANLNDLAEQLYRQHKLNRGPKIVAIGGGTGLSTLLRGLKLFTSNLTAVVTVGDDGGSSGILREEQGIIPPGDIRNCIAALADEEQLMTSLFQYRFKTGSGLEGHSFGNLFITAMSHITGDMLSAIRASCTVLKIRGRVLPSTLEPITLCATLANGDFVRGESAIPEAKQRVQSLTCEPHCPTPLPDVLTAIADAELIILGPGSLYTSVIPNLLIPKLAESVLASKAPKAYVANMVTQPGETNQMSLTDHVEALLAHLPAPAPWLNAVFVNDTLPETVIAHYEAHGAEAIQNDAQRLEALGIAVIEKPLCYSLDGKAIRHDSRKVAKAIIQWFKRLQSNQPRKKD